jgi:hypothetical protein
MTRHGLLSLMLLTAAAGFSQTQAPIAGNPKVELKGRIKSVQVVRGQGTPWLEVEAAGATTRVSLGSMRYLMEQGFNPKAGEEVVVKGYKLNGDVVAISVALPAEGKVLQLRDQSGWPLWMGGRYGRGARAGQTQ